MGTKLEQAKDALYGQDGLRVTNLKLYPGSSRDVTAEQIAEQISTVVGELKEPGEDIDKIDT